MSELSLQQSRAAVNAALEKSKEIGVKMNIAVVDAGANLKTFVPALTLSIHIVGL